MQTKMLGIYNESQGKKVNSKSWLAVNEMKASTPIDCNQLELELSNHPDKNFVRALCHSVRNGFDMLVSDCMYEFLNVKKLYQPEKILILLMS